MPNTYLNLAAYPFADLDDLPGLRAHLLAEAYLQKKEQELKEAGVEPQRNLGQLHCHRIQVHAVHIVVGDVHFHPLPLGLVGGN